MLCKFNKPLESFAGNRLYWIAINGPSCARGSFPLRWPFAVIPTPQIIVGFPTEQESLQSQQRCLNWDEDELIKLSDSWSSRDDIVMGNVSHTEQSVDGPTVWHEE